MDNKINKLLLFYNTPFNNIEKELFFQSNNDLLYKYNNDVSIVNKKYNIIIVDDSNISLKIIYNFFKNRLQINNILIAYNGIDALKQIFNSKFKIDLILIDNDMPILNGIDTVKILRLINFNNLICGITSSDGDNFIEFSNCGLNNIYMKPFTKEILYKIMKLLNN